MVQNEEQPHQEFRSPQISNDFRVKSEISWACTFFARIRTVEEGVQAAAGHEVCDEQFLVAREVVGAQGQQVAMAQAAQLLHMRLELFPVRGHVPDAFHHHHAIATRHVRFVRSSRAALAQHLRRRLQQLLQPEFLPLALIQELQPPLLAATINVSTLT